MRMGITPNEYWEMDQMEYRACAEGYKERMEDRMQENAVLACWIVNNMPIPLIKGRKALQPKQLLGKQKEAPSFSSASDMRQWLKKQKAQGGE